MNCSLANAAVLAGGAVLYAQEFRATISGRITDAQDAAVAEAKIVAIKIKRPTLVSRPRSQMPRPGPTRSRLTRT
jgi:hypothetical protein